MDTSGEYIEMCSKLPSGIRERVPRDHQGCMGGDKSFFGYHKKLNGMVWLPRQDQLQDIVYVTSKPDGVYTSLGLSLQFTSYITGNTSWNFTLEQYWLAFVMHEKYGKTWNGKEWI